MIRPRTVIPVLLLALAFGAPARAQTCSQDFECFDASDCTIDTCISGACSHTFAREGESCTDDNACTENDACDAGGVCVGGTPLPDCTPCRENDDCEDGDACSIDVCDLGRCEHEGGQGLACDDDDPCTTDDRCEEGSCFGTFLTCDDGVVCTADFCDAGACVNQPEGSSCSATSECSVSECRPDDPAADREGCVPTAGDLELAECSEDDDPCTLDRCRTGGCAHDAVEDPQGCLPLVPSYRRVVALRGGVERILNYVLDEVDAGGDTGDVIVEQLDGLAADLDAAIRVLAGRDAGAALAAGALPGAPLATGATTAQQRGRVALIWLRGTPGRVQKLLAAISRGRRTDELGPDDARELRRNGRILLAETKALKRDVKNLQRTFSVFQR